MTNRNETLAMNKRVWGSEHRARCRRSSQALLPPKACGHSISRSLFKLCVCVYTQRTDLVRPRLTGIRSCPGLGLTGEQNCTPMQSPVWLGAVWSYLTHFGSPQPTFCDGTSARYPKKVHQPWKPSLRSYLYFLMKQRKTTRSLQ